MVVFRKAQKDITGLKITGVRISDSEGWRKGQSFNVQVLNMPPEGQITVTAYEGLTAGRDPMLECVNGRRKDLKCMCIKRNFPPYI